MNYKLLKDKQFCISESIIQIIDHQMPLTEFLIILYFLNDTTLTFDVNCLSSHLNISLEEVMQGIDNLVNKKIITITQEKDLEGRLIDKVNLQGLYDLVIKKLEDEQNKQEEQTIFDDIAEAFGKKLNQYDGELINGWLNLGIPTDLIRLALQEASYNNTLNFKYIDTLLYEWTKKGFKTKEDVEKYLKTKDTKTSSEIYDYDWLNDDE